jgi:hypothetical protein
MNAERKSKDQRDNQKRPAELHRVSMDGAEREEGGERGREGD